MINGRMRQTVGNASTGILRTALNIDGVTRDAAGVALPGVAVRLFRTDNDLIRDRGVSDSAGRYGLSPYDATAHYVVGFMAATADATIFTADNTKRTADRGGQTAGVTLPTLFGV